MAPWILLAAGSKGWYNYRHQADVCHAYQVVHHNGIPDDHVVVMMYDDIAYNEENPEKGQIINEPNGPNVYSGVPKDYTHNDVTAANFLAALRGDRAAVRGKKVIQSTGNDVIFVYISDHGAPGLFAFPNTDLLAVDLLNTVKDMAKNRQFAQMVIFVESRRSGSMLEDLPENIKVYGTTASSPYESSYACFYDEKRKTYLADVYSITWMNFVEKHQHEKATFKQLFEYLISTVNKSTPHQYGEKGMSEQSVSTFLGATQKDFQPKAETELTDLTVSHEVPLKILEKKLEMETDPAKMEALQKKRTKYLQTRDSFAKSVEKFYRHCGIWQIPDLREQKLTKWRDIKDVLDQSRAILHDLYEEQLEIALTAIPAFVHAIEKEVPLDHIVDVMKMMKAHHEDAMKKLP